MFKRSNYILSSLFLAMLVLGAMSCKKDDVNDPVEPDPVDEREYTVAFAVGTGSPSSTYVQSQSDLSEGNISFSGFGFEVPSTRTARLFTSEDGSIVYNLDYGGGSIYKFDNQGSQDFLEVASTNVQLEMGTAHPRWTKISEEEALMHNVTTERIYDEQEEYVYTAATAKLLSIDLENLEMGTTSEFEIPVSVADAATGDFVFRIDAPVRVGNEVFYGMGKRGFDPNDPDARVSAAYQTVETLVVDYPGLDNPRVISTDIAGGATNGYRTPVGHVDEQGDLYQLITVPDNTFDTYILRIRDGGYDDSFSFNLSDLLGENTISNGWFYVGNGIGYVPYANSDEGGTGDAVWSVARVDLYNNQAVKLNTPDNLWLQQYQNGVVVDGEFQMVLAPIGETGYVYQFDINSNSPDAVTRGAEVESGADSYYIGIY